MKKRVVAMLLAATMTITSMPISDFTITDVQAAETSVQKSVVNTGTPAMCGTNKIQVLKGSTFNTKGVLNRVYGVDKEDGDISNSITVVSNNVNTANVGSYEVRYKVADSQGKETVFTTTVEVVQSFSEEKQTIQRTLYTKPTASNVTNVGMNRGYSHDRQHLGIIMPSESTVEIRLVNAQEFNKDLNIDLFTDDKHTEVRVNSQGKTLVVPKNGDWVTLETKKAGVVVKNEDGTPADMVPFIQTPQSKIQPIIEYRFKSDVKELTYYHTGDDQTAFLEKWDANEHAYAVVEGSSTTMLIPRRDRSKLFSASDVKEYNFSSLDEMMLFYDDFTAAFDRFVGLSHNANDPIDENVRGRYFVKADLHGAGAAYYSGDLTAQNANTLSGYLSRNWLPIHEFGHGYEGSIANKEIHLVDVFNNILCHYYERNYLKANDRGWSGLQDLDSAEIKYATMRSQGKLYEDYDYDGKLYLFVNVLNKIGAEGAMAQLHHTWRELVATKSAGNKRASDVIAEVFSDYSGYNVIPYLEAAGLYISDITKSKIYQKDYPILYFLRESFIDDAEAKTIENRLGVDGMYGLVSVEDLKLTSKTGNLKLTLDIDDINQLKGKVVELKDGNEVVRSTVIDGTTINFGNVPIGAYSINLPATKTGVYVHNHEYGVVKAGTTTEQTISYKNGTRNLLSDYTEIRMTGLGDGNVAHIKFNYNTSKVNVKVFAGQPHSIFSELYTKIQIIDNDGKELYNKEMNGNANVVGEEKEFDLEEGMRIKLYHREPGGRNVVYSNAISQSIADFKLRDGVVADRTVEYVVTKYGLMRSDWDEAKRKEVYKNQIQIYGDYLLKVMSPEEASNKYLFSKEKNVLLSTLTLLTESEKQEFLDKYSFFNVGSSPKAVLSTHLRAKVGSSFDMNQFIRIEDLEDQEAVKSQITHNIPLTTDNKFKTLGTYTVNYSAVDSDGHTTAGNFQIVVEQADKQELWNVINKAGTKKEENYTTDSYGVLKTALGQAKNTYGNTQATQGVVDQAVANMNAAINGLAAKTGNISEIQSANMPVTTGSQQSATGNQGPASNIFDGNLNTLWHTAFAGSSRELHYLDIDLNGDFDISSIIATPRQDAGNGTITKYKLQVSMDGVNYTTVSIGNWERKAGEKTVTLPTLIQAKYLRLVSLESYSDNAKLFSSLAELKILGRSHTSMINKTQAVQLLVEDATESVGYTPKSYSNYLDAKAKLTELVASPDATMLQLQEGINNFEKSREDLTLIPNKDALSAAITVAEAKVKDDYTNDTVVIFNNAINRAKALKDNENATQQQVDQGTLTLQLATNNLILKIKEFTELPTKDMIATSPSYEGGYTPSKVLDGDTVSHWHTRYTGDSRELQYITLQLGDLYEINGIRQTPRAPGTNGFITKYRVETSIDGENFTKVSEGDWANTAGVKEVNFEQAVKAKFVRVYAVESKTDASKKNYAAIAELRVIGKHASEIADKTQLRSTISLAREKQEADYTKASFKVFKEKYDDAIMVESRIDASQTLVDKTNTDLVNAMNALVSNTINKEALHAAIIVAQAKDSSKYTADSFSKLTAALNEAKALASSSNASQVQVDSATSKLNAAINSLVLKPADKTELNNLVTNLPTINEQEYTVDSYQAFQSALTKANELLQKANATQEEVDIAKVKLQEALDGLKKKPIDKVSLNAAIVIAESKNAQQYTAISFSNLTTALNEAKAIVQDDQATQLQVDAAAKKLNDAIKNLVLKPVDVEELSVEGMRATAGSEQPNHATQGKASYVLDANVDTMWHTKWDGSELADHYLTIDLGGLFNVSGIHATPRNPVGNGTIKKYELQVSMDGETFTTVSRGNWAASAGQKEADIATVVPAKYVRLVSLEAVSNEKNKLFASLAELRVVGKAHTQITDKTQVIGLLFEELIEDEGYIAESYQAYLDALDQVNAIIAKDDATQEQVEATIQAYHAAVEGLKKPVIAESIVMSKDQSKLKVGETEKLSATIAPSNTTDQSIKWSTSDARVVTVVNGVVTANGVGSATVTATSNGLTATCKYEVASDVKPEPNIEPGWKKDNKGKYYVRKDGSMPKNQWEKIDNTWYYFKDKYVQYNWQKISNVWYYLGSNGKMVTGWQKVGGVWYLFNGSGRMLTGWQKEKGTWYYMNGSGKMLTGWQKISGVWYLFNGSGKMLTGWQKEKGTWYYLHGSGKMLTGWQKISGTWYYFNGGGKMVTGWLKLGSTWYYLKSSGAMVTGRQVINGKVYNFNASGVWLK